MPCKNAASTLEAAVNSILSQSIGDFELLIWDDGSSDGTARVLGQLAQCDSRVRILGSDPVGLVGALRILGQRAAGSFAARMDADDISLPSRFERQLEYMRANPEVGLCGCLYETVGAPVRSGRIRYDAWINSLITPEAIRRDLFVECPVPHPSFMLPMTVFRAVGGYEDRGWPEDYDLLFRVAAAGLQIGKAPEVLLQWRHHSGQTSLTHERYSETLFRAVKRHYLNVLYADRMPRLHQWGAGRVGKRWLREWDEVRPQAVVDIHPRKIGTRIHGYQIIAPEELPPPGAAFTVVVVGAPGARDEIRGWFTPRGYKEGADFIFVA